MGVNAAESDGKGRMDRLSVAHVGTWRMDDTDHMQFQVSGWKSDMLKQMR